MKGVRDARNGSQEALHPLAGIELAVARALAEAADAAETYDRVLAEIGTALGWQLGAVWEVSSDADLRCVALWQASQSDTREFQTITEGLTLSRGKGLPGRVWATGEAAWIVDVVRTPTFRARERPPGPVFTPPVASRSGAWARSSARWSSSRARSRSPTSRSLGR
jgi:hypothetical protein